MNFFHRNTSVVTFTGMFFWWALIVLYLSMRWEGVTVYVIGLIPALVLCLITAWGTDQFRIVESWRKRAAIGWGLNIATHLIWLFGTKAAARSRGIEFGVDGPFIFGGMAVWVNLFALLIIQFSGIVKLKK